MNLLDNLSWRYATKKFDAIKKVAQQDINFIKEAVQLSASSYGLQPYKVLEISNLKLREELKPICWNQSQITDASHLFLFCSHNTVTDHDVDDLIRLKAETNNIPLEKIEGYGDFMKGKLNEKSELEMFNWTGKQTYIALGNAIVACAELKLDATPIEGFEADKVNEQLGLTERGLNACVFLAIGYRHKEDAAQHSKKVRKSTDVLFESI